MNFEAFDVKQIDQYAEEAKASWGETPTYKEFEQKRKNRSREDETRLSEGLMDILSGFQPMMEKPAGDTEPQEQVKLLQSYITEHYYHCTKPILASLGLLYAGGGAMTENIDKACGQGVANYAAKAIEIFCK